MTPTKEQVAERASQIWLALSVELGPCIGPSSMEPCKSGDCWCAEASINQAELELASE